MSSDPELLRRYLRESSQEAFAELVRRHINFVYAAALRQAGSPSRAEDVTQAVFTDLAKKAAQLATRNDLVGWLHTSTHYAATSIRRSEARREARELKAHMIKELAATPEENANWQELGPVLDEVLRSLSERDREAILLRYFKQQSFEEIGTTLGLSEEAVRKRIDRGVAKLHTLLWKRGITSTIVALEIAMASQAAVAAPAGLATTIAGTAITTACAAAPIAKFFAQLISSIKTAAAGAAVIAAFVSGGLVMHSAGTACDAEQTLTTEKQRLVTLQKQRDQLTNYQAEVNKSLKVQQQALAELKAKIAARIHRLNPKISGEKVGEALLQLNLDTEMKELLKTAAPLLFSTQYFCGPLLTELQLTPQQIDRFFDISLGNAPFMPTYKFLDEGNGHGRFTYSLAWENKELDENAMRQLLGEAGFKRYEQDHKTSTIRMLVVNRLASNLVYTDTPLNATVAKQLTQILANATADPENPSATEINWEKTLKDAKAILTPTQLTALARLSGNLSTKWSYDF